MSAASAFGTQPVTMSVIITARVASAYGARLRTGGAAQTTTSTARATRQPQRTRVVSDTLAAPDRAADLDDLAGAGEGSVVGNAMEPLDHLWTGRAEPENEAATRHVVEPGCGHGEQAGCTGVDGQDPRADLDAFGAGGDVAHDRDAVEAVCLGDPDLVEAGLLECDDLFDGGFVTDVDLCEGGTIDALREIECTTRAVDIEA